MKCICQVKFMKPQLGIYSVSAYEGVLKTALHRFKFQKRKKLSKPLGLLLVKYLAQSGIDMNEIDQIVPVPLHPNRLRHRGYNQVELLAGVIRRYYEKPVVAALVREKNTLPQFDLPRERRFENIRDAFRLTDAASVKDKKVLLLDDIYTTGSTIAECVKCLQAAGVAKIEILTLSRAIVD